MINVYLILKFLLSKVDKWLEKMGFGKTLSLVVIFLVFLIVCIYLEHRFFETICRIISETIRAAVAALCIFAIPTLVHFLTKLNLSARKRVLLLSLSILRAPAQLYR